MLVLSAPATTTATTTTIAPTLFLLFLLLSITRDTVVFVAVAVTGDTVVIGSCWNVLLLLFEVAVAVVCGFVVL